MLCSWNNSINHIAGDYTNSEWGGDGIPTLLSLRYLTDIQDELHILYILDGKSTLCFLGSARGGIANDCLVSLLRCEQNKNAYTESIGGCQMPIAGP